MPRFIRIHRLSSTILLAFILAVIFSLSAQVLSTFASSSSLGSCQCTDYVYSQRPDIPRGMGNAKDWVSSAANRGYSYDQVPQVGDVAVFINGSHGFSVEYGHVAMVTWVNDTHTRYNIEGWDGLKANCVLESYSNLAVTQDDWFIHNTNGSIPPQPPPASQPSTGRIEFSPVSPAQAGQTVEIFVTIQPGNDFRAARLLIDYQVIGESSAPQFHYSWNTAGFLPSVHTIRLEIASQDDSNWVHPTSYEISYLLSEAPQPSNQSPNTPSPVSPTNGQTLTDNPQLCWKNNGDPDGDPAMTRVELWGAQSLIGPWLNGDNPCWSPSGLISGQYSWAVRARDDKGAESGASSAWSFNLELTSSPESTSYSKARIGYYKNLYVYYDPNIWVSSLVTDPGHDLISPQGEKVESLSHKQYSCNLHENAGHGMDSERYHKTVYEKRIGQTIYQVEEWVDTLTGGTILVVYQYPPNTQYGDYRIELTIEDHPEECMRDAEEILLLSEAELTGLTSSGPSDLWPDTLIGDWEGDVSCQVTFRPAEMCHIRFEIKREEGGDLDLIQTESTYNYEEGDYKMLSDNRYYYCFDQYATINGEYIHTGEWCFIPLDGMRLEISAGELSGSMWGFVTKVNR